MRQEQVGSGLLSPEENQIIAAMVGSRCQALATTVVQVYLSLGPGHSYRWNKRVCGVVCFVKDNLRRSYFIRVYDLDNNTMVLEQEIYNQFKYKTPRPYFHTFEGDDAQIGLNFADEKEGETFQQTIEEKVRERRDRRDRRQSSKRNVTQSNGGGRPTNGGMGKVAKAYTSSAPPPSKKESKSNKIDKKKLKKEDIGMPTNFQHISHVGWDPNRGFDLENVDPNLKKFFQKAGVDEKTLQDKDTRDFIYDFIDKHGGVEAALREVNNSPDLFAPPPPPRAMAPPNNATRATPPQAPPPPPQVSSLSRSSSSVTRTPPPPPPPPVHSIPAPPPPPPPTAAAPPPPPPNVGVPAPPPPPSLPPVNDSRSTLLDEIRKGGSLRHVSPEKTQRPAVLDTRGDLMGQIRLGVTLKKVDPEAANAEGGPAPDSGIAGMLQRALQERGVAMGLSSTDESDVDEDDEWD